MTMIYRTNMIPAGIQNTLLKESGFDRCKNRVDYYFVFEAKV